MACSVCRALVRAAGLLVSLPLALHGQGKVYLVLGSDTGLWNTNNTVDVYHYHSFYKPDLFTRPQNNAVQVMDPAFRDSFVDSYGQPLKLTWWMMVGSNQMFAQAADGTDQVACLWAHLPESDFLSNIARIDTIAKVGMAVTDLAGNLTTRIIRYLPDDLYLDNLDPQHVEVAGKEV